MLELKTLYVIIRKLPLFVCFSVFLACLIVEPLTGQEKPKLDGTEESEPTRTDAEQVLRLRQGIINDTKALEAARAELDKITESKKKLNENMSDLSKSDIEYLKALASFEIVDGKLRNLEEEMAKWKKDGQTQKAESLQKTATTLQEEWKLARDRFDNAIKGLRQLHERVKTLPKKIAEDQRALDRLLGIEVKTETPKDSENKVPSATPSQPQEQPKQAVQRPVPNAPKSPNETVSPKKPETLKKKVNETKAEVKAARDQEQNILNRLESLQEQINLETKTMQIEREKADLASNEIRSFTAELQKQANAPPEARNTLVEKIREAEQRGKKARLAVRAGIERLEQLKEKKNELLVEKVEAANALKLKELQLKQATATLSDLENPLSFYNIQQWLWKRGPKLGLILLITLILVWAPKVFVPRIIKVIYNKNRKFKSDREARTQTLMGALTGTFRFLVVVVATLMVLDELGVPIMPLLSGAAVFGLAVAFAVQHLLRDYANGFYILWEDQYGINDVIEVDQIRGVVEKISMRMTTIRSVDGGLHFVPNGSINTVSNLTHGWSRMQFEIGVSYKENPDYVMNVIRDVVTEMREDDEFGPSITSDPELMGVNEFSDSAVIIHFIIKTKPLKQWDIKREFLRRIKHRFDEVGIEIPFPQRVVSVQNANRDSAGTNYNNEQKQYSE